MKNNKFKVLAWNKLMQCYGVTGNYLYSEYLCTTKTVSLGIYRETELDSSWMCAAVVQEATGTNWNIGIRNNFHLVVKLWNRLLREILESPSLGNTQNSTGKCSEQFDPF